MEQVYRNNLVQFTCKTNPAAPMELFVASATAGPYLKNKYKQVKEKLDER